MNTKVSISRSVVGMQSLLIAFGTLSFLSSEPVRAQMDCPDLGVIATGLQLPSKMIQTPLGNYLVAEVGSPDGLNTARISIVGRNGDRRTLLEGLPSARAFTGDPSGSSGLWLQGRTLYLLNGQGDVTVPGPVQGTEQANLAPASPIFSSVLAMDFPESLEKSTAGFSITLASHQSLKRGEILTITNAAGESTTLRLLVDFLDYQPDPRPVFTDNVRHSHPYGLVADSTHLYIVDAGLNRIRKVELATATEETLTSFPPTPSPLTNGPPVIENVPTSIHWVAGKLIVTTLGGAPFLPGYSKVWQIDPQSGGISSLVENLTTAIDSTPLVVDTLDGGLLTLEHDLSFPKSGWGRLQSFTVTSSIGITNSSCLTTPSSMLIDRMTARLILTELGTGRLVWLPIPSPLIKGSSIYWSSFDGGDIRRTDLDGAGPKVLVSGRSRPIGPTLDLVRGQMYWGDVGTATMWRANLDGTGQKMVVSSPNGGSPTLDLVGGRMYWSVSSRGNIWRANLDGSDQQLLLSGQKEPHSVVLDSKGEKMYWPESGAGNIWRANLDGTEAKVIVSGLAGPSLMALNVPSDKMYWTGAGSGDIRRANLNGSSQEILIRNLNSPAGIALDTRNGRLYWASYGGGEIGRANLNGSDQEILLRGLSGPSFLALDFAPLRTPDFGKLMKSDGALTMTWTALLGRAYQVQFKTNLNQQTWSNLVPRVTATNVTASAVELEIGDSRRFYRTVLLP